MSGFRLRLNRLRNIPYASSIQELLPFESSFEMEYSFNGQWNWVVVKPILINTVVIFLVQFPEADDEPMALVYNKKDVWSDIEKSLPVLRKPLAPRSKSIILPVIYPGQTVSMMASPMAIGITIY